MEGKVLAPPIVYTAILFSSYAKMYYSLDFMYYSLDFDDLEPIASYGRRSTDRGAKRKPIA